MLVYDLEGLCVAPMVCVPQFRNHCFMAMNRKFPNCVSWFPTSHESYILLSKVVSPLLHCAWYKRKLVVSRVSAFQQNDLVLISGHKVTVASFCRQERSTQQKKPRSIKKTIWVFVPAPIAFIQTLLRKDGPAGTLLYGPQQGCQIGHFYVCHCRMEFS